MKAWARLTCAVSLAAVAACAQGGGGGSSDAGGSSDGGRRDAGRDGGRRDAGTDAGRRDAGSTDASMRDTGSTDAGGGIDAGHDAGGSTCPVEAGSLAIVEVMISSRSGSGDRGEWFEVVNTRDCTLDITGLVIVSPSGSGAEQMHTVTGGAVSAGQHYVFALSADAGENHLLPFDYAYGTGAATDVVFNNDSDWIELRAGATVVDRVAWPSGGFTHGRARQFPAGSDPAANDDWSGWCDATDIYSDAGGTFYGTPQAANGSCS